MISQFVSQHTLMDCNHAGRFNPSSSPPAAAKQVAQQPTSLAVDQQQLLRRLLDSLLKPVGRLWTAPARLCENILGFAPVVLPCSATSQNRWAGLIIDSDPVPPGTKHCAQYLSLHTTVPATNKYQSRLAKSC
jgi:hypothetical protein